jgi:hypothetical protein
MKTPSYTPGPWIAYDMGNGLRVAPSSVEDDLIPHFSAVLNEVAHLKPNAGRRGFSEEMWEIQKANAELIAAAPELYEMLEKINEVFYARASEKEWLELMEQTKPLLQKARGAE